MSTPKGHLPPAGMQNHSGALVTKLARDINEAVKANDTHLSADVIASVLCTLGVDLWRANYPNADGQCVAALSQTIRRRCEKPPEYWGVGTKAR